MYQTDLLATQQARLYRRGKGTFCIAGKTTLQVNNKVFCVDVIAQQAARKDSEKTQC